MSTNLSTREWEDLSAYLDGQLSAREKARLQRSLDESPRLRRALEELSRTRQLIRSSERLRAPHNFTLTPEMAGISLVESKRPAVFPVFSFISALAAVFFVLVFAADMLLGIGERAAPMSLAEPLEKSIAVEEAQPQTVLPERESGGLEMAATEEVLFEMPREAGEDAVPEMAAADEAEATTQAVELPVQEIPTLEATQITKAAPPIPEEKIQGITSASRGDGITQQSPWDLVAGWVLHRATLRTLEVSLLVVALLSGLLARITRRNRRL